MASAPTPKLVEGAPNPGQVPHVPAAIESERLYPPLPTVERPGALLHVVAVSLILHGAALLALVDLNTFGEERVEGGSEELVVIEGIDVVLLDQIPSAPAPLAEGRPIEADVAEPAAVAEARSVVEEYGAQIPAEPPSHLPGDRPEMISDTIVSANVTPPDIDPVPAAVPSVAAPSPVTASAAYQVAHPASAVLETAEPVTAAALPRVREDRQVRTVSDLPADVVPPADAAESLTGSPDPGARDRVARPVATATAERPSEASADPVAEPEASRSPARPLAPERVSRMVQVASVPEAAPTSNEAAIRREGEPPAQRIETVDPAPTAREREPTAARSDEGTLLPADETKRVTPTEIIPEPPLPRKNPLEIVQSKPAAKSPTASAKPSAAASASVASQPARGPGRGKAGAGGKARNVQGAASLSTYQSRLVAHLRRYRSYPAAARRSRTEGTAGVRITVDRNGRVIGVSLARSSGHGILDREAIAMVRRASPFPPIPAGLGRSQITIRAPIRFDIR